MSMRIGLPNLSIGGQPPAQPPTVTISSADFGSNGFSVAWGHSGHAVFEDCNWVVWVQEDRGVLVDGETASGTLSSSLNPNEIRPAEYIVHVSATGPEGGEDLGVSDSAVVAVDRDQADDWSAANGGFDFSKPLAGQLSLRRREQIDPVELSRGLEPWLAEVRRLYEDESWASDPIREAEVLDGLTFLDDPARKEDRRPSATLLVQGYTTALVEAVAELQPSAAADLIINSSARLANAQGEENEGDIVAGVLDDLADQIQPSRTIEPEDGPERQRPTETDRQRVEDLGDNIGRAVVAETARMGRKPLATTAGEAIGISGGIWTLVTVAGVVVPPLSPLMIALSVLMVMTGLIFYEL